MDKNGNDLELAVNSIFREIEQTKREFILQGPEFGKMDQPKDGNRTQGNLRKIKNTLNFQRHHVKSKEPAFKKQPAFMPKSTKSESTQTDKEDEGAYKPEQAAKVQHYKPQELIRLELENDQMKSENEHLQAFGDELLQKVDHLTECIKECNSNIFLKE